MPDIFDENSKQWINQPMSIPIPNITGGSAETGSADLSGSSQSSTTGDFILNGTKKSGVDIPNILIYGAGFLALVIILKKFSAKA
jgi:hypothetical protein